MLDTGPPEPQMTSISSGIHVSVSVSVPGLISSEKKVKINEKFGCRTQKRLSKASKIAKMLDQGPGGPSGGTIPGDFAIFDLKIGFLTKKLL